MREPEENHMTTAPRIHSSAIVGDGVTLGEEVTIGPNAVLLGPLEIGNRVWIGPGSVIGTPPEISSLPQNAAWEGELMHAGVVIEDDVVIRELSTISQGSHRSTRIGSGTWILNTSYVAHDVEIGTGVTLSAGTRIGGHATIGDHVTLGLNSSVHQRRVIGAGSMIGMGTAVSRDVHPFSKVFGSPVRRHGANAYVLRKLGADPEVAARVEAALNSDPVDLRPFAGDPVIGPLISSWLGADIQPEMTVKKA